jgi:ADP-heptose:LPS heptosyltransferase
MSVDEFNSHEANIRFIKGVLPEVDSINLQRSKNCPRRIPAHLCSMNFAPTKILVIRFSSIGDIVLTTPVLRALSQQLDGPVEIHYLTKKSYATLLEANPYVHQVHAIERTVQEVLPTLEAIGFDYIIDLHSNIRSRVVKRKLGSLSFTVSKCNWAKWLLVQWGIRRKPIPHIVDRYMDTLRAFSCQSDGKGLDYFLPADTMVTDQMQDAIRCPYMIAALGATHLGKRLNAAQWINILNPITQPVVLIGGKDEIELAQAIVKACTKEMINLCGGLSLHQSAWIISHSQMVVSGDTGMMHVAAALKKDIVSLWGCTSPELGMSPYLPGTHSVIIEPRNRAKRPCSKLGDRCKYGTDSRCIQQLDVQEMISAIETLWVQQTAP